METTLDRQEIPTGSNIPEVLPTGEPAVKPSTVGDKSEKAVDPKKPLSMKDLYERLQLVEAQYEERLGEMVRRISILETSGGGLMDVAPAPVLPADFMAQIVAELQKHDAAGGLEAPFVGGIFNCPECGLRITGPSLTAENGSKGSAYEHPFGESPKLGGRQCRLIGKKFKPPVIRLEFAPTPLTGKKQ